VSFGAKKKKGKKTKNKKKWVGASKIKAEDSNVVGTQTSLELWLLLEYI